MGFVPINNDIFLVVLDNAMHCLDDVKPTMKEKVFECELFKYESFYTGGIGRKSLLIFDGPGGPKYSAGKAV
jgi:hypothetical protein